MCWYFRRRPPARTPTPPVPPTAPPDAAPAPLRPPDPPAVEPAPDAPRVAAEIDPEPDPEPDAVVAGYAGSDEHLADELRRVEQLVRAVLFRRKSAGLAAGPDRDGFAPESQAVLRADFRWDDPVTNSDCAAARDRALDAAARCERHIVARLRLTPRTRSAAADAHKPAARGDLRAWELARVFGLVPYLDRAVPPFGTKPDDPELVRETLLLDVVLLAVLAERSPRYRAALGTVAAGAGGLTEEVVLQVLQPRVERGQYRWAAFAAGGPLRAHSLVHFGPGDDPATRTVRADPRVADYLLRADGDDAGLGEAVRVVAEPFDIHDLGVEGPVQQRVKDLADWWPGWWQKTPEPRRFVALFHGPYGSPTLEAARAFWLGSAPRGRRRLLVVDVPKAPTGADWVPFVRRVYREARLRNRAVFWQGAEPLLAEAGETRWEDIVAEAEAFEFPTFLASETAWDPSRAFHGPNRIFARVEFPVPGADARRSLWKVRLAAEGSVLAADRTPVQTAALDLIASFQFTEGQIDDAVATARGLFRPPAPRPPDPTGSLDAEVYYEACRRQSGRRLVSFAQRIQPRPGDCVPDDRKEAELLTRLVLSETAERHLLELFRRMRHLTTVYHELGFEHRLSLGRGLIALFTGPSGTGKTYAAATLAGFLQKDLYKVDMAAVVSKYVGETEKNLSRVFADAQNANAVLFFDEADALFGKRGEVEQAQDRWANLEVNYLLQRVEEYTGTVILATNFRHNIDEAFLRRVQMMIEFDRPTPEARLKILTGLFRGTAVDAPDADLVLRPVAEQFKELTGGNLKNVVLDAVFRAVAEPRDGGRVRVTARHLVLGAAREYQKLGKPVNAATFGKEWAVLVEDELKIPTR